MNEIIFTDLGYFTEKTAKKVQELMQNRSFMNFQVSYSNCAGNCILIVRTDYEASEEKIKKFFLNCLITDLTL